jgi:di/tricarboxylate transporter
LCSLILIGTLALFISGRLRPDAVALCALFAAVIAGIVTPVKALAGFGDPAVVAVAAVMVVGQTLQTSGIAGWVARSLIPEHAGFTIRLTMLLVGACVLSAFMNHVAALIICMPLATEIARTSKMSPGHTLMPLSFATMIGGMTTLIATPPNMILSSIRQQALGAPFGFFTMTPVGVSVCVVGLLYLTLIGWRLLPSRKRAQMEADAPWRVMELPLDARRVLDRDTAARQLRKVQTRILAFLRNGRAIKWPRDNHLKSGDALLLLSRRLPAQVREAVDFNRGRETAEPGHVTAGLMVTHGSPLIGRTHDSVRSRSQGKLHVAAAGPRAATFRCPLGTVEIESGDQLFISGPPDAIAAFSTNERLIEVDRRDSIPVNLRKAAFTLGIFACAVACVLILHVPPAVSFLGAAALVTAFGLLTVEEAYGSVNWSIIVLLAAMIPVGASFESTGAAAFVAQHVGALLQNTPLIVAIAAVCTLTLGLSILIHNAPAAIIMGPIALQIATLLHVEPNALLLAVLVGASCDFLTPIGHENNLIIMEAGGYRFTDYSRLGAGMSLLVIATAAIVLSLQYG